MRRRLSLAATLVLAGMVTITGQQPPARSAIPGSTMWTVEGAARMGDVKVEPFLDRPSLWLRNNTHAIRTDTRFTDGTIEFDLAPMAEGDFAAVVFRRESITNHENIYIRPRQSGRFMAIQYAPRINGSSTWQLYPQFTAALEWPRHAWTHVRVEVHGSRLEVFVGGASTPTLVVPRLRHRSATGEVAFWGRVNNRPEVWAAAISNISITPAADAPRLLAPASERGVVTNWQVAGPLPAASTVVTVPAGLTWEPMPVEESGLLNINSRVPVQPRQGPLAVFARTTIQSATARRVLAGIGYSDEVTVFVNGEPIYTARNGWESRYPEYVGFVDPRFERVWLPLRAGENEVVLAVTDDQRFGWGCAMTIEP